MRIELRIRAGAEPLLARRTERALARLGLSGRVVDEPELLDELARSDTPTWVLAAGAWPTRAPTFHASATGRPLVGLGIDPADPRFRAWLSATGGEGAPAQLARREAPLELPSLLLEAPQRAGRPATWSALVEHVLDDDTLRVVRLPALDARFDDRPRFAQVVTTLHRGGAERVALDLHTELQAAGAASTLYVLDRPRRATYPAPPGTIAAHEWARNHEARLAALVAACVEEGHDVVHLHLADGSVVRALEHAGVPTVTTLHNLRRAWPPGVAELTRGEARLVVACAASVAREVAPDAPPTRVAWNGIAPVPALGRRASTRAALEIPAGALAVITVANPRAQKRLDLAAETIAELARERDVVWLLVGAPLTTNADARAAAAALDDVIARRGLAPHVRRLGSRDDVHELLEAADVALSTSAWEGFSIAHLEAIAAGVPLVSTVVSGATELARTHRGVVLCADESPTALAAAVLRAAEGPRPALAPELGRTAMARRHEALYRRAVAHSARREDPVWLVTNNFSIGGAQASARRLLLGWRERGIDARAVVLEEHRLHKTPWLTELEVHGVPVVVAPRIATADAAEAVVEAIDAHGARAVVFWNAIAEYKIRISDALLGVPVFDVSPGEMYFASLERYFAKPRLDLPYLDARDYGRLLAGVVVKFGAEGDRAAATLGTRVHVVQNGVPLRPERPRRGRTGEPLRIGTLARISPDKKLEQLLEGARAARRHTKRPFELRVAGPVETGHEAYARELELEARSAGVELVGAVGADEFLDDLDLFALVSEPEGCPNASLEAMAAGLAVVATDAGGVREQIARGESGLLVPRGDGAALGEAIASLVEDDGARLRMGLAARARIQEKFSVERMLDQYARIVLAEELAAR